MKDIGDLCKIYDSKLFNMSDFNVLLHEILKQTRVVLNANAGSIYIEKNGELCFNVFQNDSMSYEDIYKNYYYLKDLKLPISEVKYLAVKSFCSRKIILIDDAYKYDFSGVKEFDKLFNYKTKSMITAPIIHPIENKVLGVLQLLDKMEDGKVTIFDEKDKSLLSMVTFFIAIAISKAKDDVGKLKKLNKKLEDANKKLQLKIDKEIKKSREKSLIIYHQSKLTSLGEMIGNIAHQWRQPLSAISTMASGLSFNIEYQKYDEVDALKTLNNIVRTTQHLSQTIDDFREFYNIDKEEKNFELSKDIESALDMIEASLFQNHITLITSFEENIFILGYENEFKQAILNIIQNAKEALIQNIESGMERLIFIDLKKNKEDILITIKDNAGGVDEDILDKIFNQSFTTKEDFGGTGIGLYMTKQIIEEHMHGILEVSNEYFTYEEVSYKGAVFSIKLKTSIEKNH